MPDNAGSTIRDLLLGFSTMQQHLGLTPLSPQAQGYGAPLTPVVKSPGQFSMETIQQAQAQAQMGAAGTYAAQYRERMSQIESQYLPPYMAHSMARQTGQAGFSHLPSPLYQTAPQMGIFRPSLSPPPPPAPVRPFSLFSSSSPLGMFSPTLPSPQFSTPFEESYTQRAQRDQLMFSGAMAGMSGAAWGTGVGLTGLAGASWGSRFGKVGQIGGAIGGITLGLGATGPAAQWGADTALQPAVQTRQFGQQLEDITRRFVVSGPSLHPLGQGLATRSAVGLAGRMQRDVERGETGGFNMQDMVSLTRQAADTGFLDMAQNGEQIAQQMRNIAKGLKSFMRIAREPDVQQALGQMAQMRTLGLSVPESLVAERNARQFAQMAGVSRDALRQGAQLPGAMTFQQLGMTGGLGYQVGGAAAGLAQQAIAGGAFTPGQLAMAGGASGVAQTFTETAAAGIGVDFPLMAMLKRNAQGQLAIDANRANQVMSGRWSLSEQANMAAQNVSQLGGESVIQELSTRMNELRDELGRTLGPQASVMLTLRQASNLMREVPGMSLGGALTQLMKNDPLRARTTEVAVSNPQFWQNLRDQHVRNIDDHRREERARVDQIRSEGTAWGGVKRWWKEPGVLDVPGAAVRSASESISQWFTDRQEMAQATEEGAFYVGEGQTYTSAQRTRAQAFTGGGGLLRQSARESREMMRGANRAASGQTTVGEKAGAVWNLARPFMMLNPVGAVAGLLGVMPASEAPDQTLGAQAALAGGGVMGALTGLSSSFSVLGGSDANRANIARLAGPGGIVDLGQMINASRQMSLKEEFGGQRDIVQRAAEIHRAVGTGKRPQMDDLFQVGSQALSAFFAGNSSMLASMDKAATLHEAKKVVQSSLERKYGVAVGRKLMQDMGDQIMPRIIKEVERVANPDARAVIEKIRESAPAASKIAGANLKEVRENIKESEEQIKENLGMDSWFGRDVGWSAFTELLETRGADEVLLLQAQTLRRTGKDEDVAKAAAIEKGLRTRLGEKDLSGLREKVGDDVKTLGEKERQALERTGRKLGEIRSGAGQHDILDRVRSGHLRRRAADTLLSGAAALSEDVSALSGFKGTDLASTTEVMGKISGDSAQLKKLRELSPAAAVAVEDYTKTKDEKHVAEFQTALQRHGAKTTLGAKGAGSVAEQREKEAMGREAAIEEAISGGKPQEAFAMAVPVLHKAAEKLYASAEELAKIAQVQSIKDKLPFNPLNPFTYFR